MHKNLFRSLISQIENILKVFPISKTEVIEDVNFFFLAQNIFIVDLSLGNQPSPLSISVVSAMLTWVVVELKLVNHNNNPSHTPIPNSDVTKPDLSWGLERALPMGDAVKVTLAT